jgi:hypothetical protein
MGRPVPHAMTRTSFPALSIVVLGSLLASGAFIARTMFVVDGERYFTLFDDAMISMRYARNLANGDGLLWNPGETPVEGYSSLLWTLWMACLHAVQLPASKVALAVMISSAAILIAHLWFVHRIALTVSDGCRRTAACSVALVGFYYPLVFWSVRGLEVGLHTLIASAAAWQVLQLRRAVHTRRFGALAALLASAVLVRPDAVVLCAVVIVFAVRAAAPGTRAKSAAALIVPLLAIAAAHTMFRLAYYGDVLPNTYYLKLTGAPFSERLTSGVIALATLTLWHLLVPVALASVIWRRVNEEPALSLLAVIVVGQCAFSVYAGGDAWEWMNYANRYITVGMPALLILAACGMTRILDRCGAQGRSRTAMAVVLVSAVLGQTTIPHAIRWVQHGGAEVNWDKERARLGIALHMATPSHASLGVMSAGAIPYFAERRGIDLLGKNDPLIAREPARPPFHPGHDKRNYPYSIGVLQPDIVIQVSVDDDVSDQAVLKADYDAHRLVFPDGLDGVIYIKRGSAVSLTALQEALSKAGWRWSDRHTLAKRRAHDWVTGKPG